MSVKVQLTNEMTKDIKTLTVGFDVGAFFSPLLVGVPHFIRKMWIWGGSLVGFQVFLMILFSGIGNSDEELLGAAILQLAACLGVGVYTGIKGQAAYAKHLLANGYQFREPEADETTFAKDKWGIL